MLFAFGIIMISLGVLGKYICKTFDAYRNRHAYIIEQEYDERS